MSLQTTRIDRIVGLLYRTFVETTVVLVLECPCRQQSCWSRVSRQQSFWSRVSRQQSCWSRVSLQTTVVLVKSVQTTVVLVKSVQTTVVLVKSVLADNSRVGQECPCRQQSCWSRVSRQQSCWSRVSLQTTAVLVKSVQTTAVLVKSVQTTAVLVKSVLADNSRVGQECPCRQQPCWSRVSLQTESLCCCLRADSWRWCPVWYRPRSICCHFLTGSGSLVKNGQWHPLPLLAHGVDSLSALLASKLSSLSYSKWLRRLLCRPVNTNTVTDSNTVMSR